MEDVIDVHACLQQRDADVSTLIMRHTAKIDDHVETCEACHTRVMSWTYMLPKLFARIKVDVPEAHDYHAHWEQLKQLGRGQCLPCGCVVTDVAWTKEQAENAFFIALSKIMECDIEKVRDMSPSTKIRDLHLDTESLRRLRDSFWMPDGSYASKVMRDLEEGTIVKQLPRTIDEFVTRIHEIHSGISFTECIEHWSP